MTRIADVLARQILDSRGNPTVEVAEKLARANGDDWSALPLEHQDRYFDLAKEAE